MSRRGEPLPSPSSFERPTQTTVSIDGKLAGTATLSIARPDVAAYFGNPAFANSGWSLELNLSGLSLGSHTVTAMGTDSALQHRISKVSEH